MSKKEDIQAALRVAIVNLLEYGYSPHEINTMAEKMLAKIERSEHQPSSKQERGLGGVGRLEIKEGITYDPIEQCVLYDDRSKSLSPTEAKLLHTFLVNRGKVLTYREIVRSVQRKPETTDYDMTTRNWIHSLRSRLEEIPGSESWISNVRGVGYYFSVE